ncbi:uncharacterized protein [Medicago truncatula]|uniref:uncharacterized protein n=1 Tax=Medicago truncatula TaxID=3880 RepID=UPI001967F189|nr:uncharacterized protein LOC112418582 [Medicago truncatula]
MFTSQQWSNLKVSDEVKGRKTTSIVLQVSFWDDIVYALKAMGPLIKVLRLDDNEKVLAMGFLYQAMVDAKNQINKNFGENESKYKPIIEIIDRRWSNQLYHPLHAAGHFLNPKHFYNNPEINDDDLLEQGLYECIRKLAYSPENADAIHGDLDKYRDGLAACWKRWGSKTPNLKLLAIKILSLTVSASGCERNCSTFEHIHSKKRNRLEHEMLQKLIFVKYNQTLKENRESDEYIDSVLMDDPEINADVEEASGAAEPLFNTRSQAAAATALAAPPPSKSKGKGNQGASGKQGEKVYKGKGKKVVVVDEYDPEFVTDWGDEEKEDEEEENEEKEDEAEHMNNGGSGSYYEDFHDY